jgi:hypothetical protein
MSGTSGAQLPVTVGTAAEVPTIFGNDEYYSAIEGVRPGPLNSELPIRCSCSQQLLQS